MGKYYILAKFCSKPYLLAKGTIHGVLAYQAECYWICEVLPFIELFFLLHYLMSLYITMFNIVNTPVTLHSIAICICLSYFVTNVVKHIVFGVASFSWTQWNTLLFAQQKSAWSAKGEYRDASWIITQWLVKMVQNGYSEKLLTLAHCMHYSE
jgi:hypothetical protein